MLWILKLKENEKGLKLELYEKTNALDHALTDKAAALQEIDALRIQLNSVESDHSRLQSELTASEVRLGEVKESAKAQLQKAVDKIRTLTASVDSKDQQLNELKSQLEANQDESQIRMRSLEADIKKFTEDKIAQDTFCAELRNSLESVSLASASKVQALEEQLIKLEKEISSVKKFQNLMFSRNRG